MHRIRRGIENKKKNFYLWEQMYRQAMYPVRLANMDDLVYPFLDSKTLADQGLKQININSWNSWASSRQNLSLGFPTK